MNLSYRKAVKNDADLLIDIYNSSFYDDYIRYGECPAYGRTKEKMELSIINIPKYIIMSSGTPIGVFSIESRGNGQYYLGCLCIIPAYQRMGIGAHAFQYMLSVYSDWILISLVTPADKEQNIKFYTEKCGFHTGAKTMDGNVEVINLYMERFAMDECDKKTS